MKLDSRYADYFTEYSKYFGKSLILLKSMYGITNSGKLFADELTEWFIEAVFVQYQYHMTIYYNYAPYGTHIVVLSYVYDYIYWYNYEALGKWFVDTLGKIFLVNFLVYANWFISIRINQMKDHLTSVDQDRYDTSILDKYLDNVTFKTSTNFYKITLISDMIFTKADASTSDEKIEKLSK